MNKKKEARIQLKYFQPHTCDPGSDEEAVTAAQDANCYDIHIAIESH